MSRIHPSAIIDSSAQLADDVIVGPYCIIGPNCTIGEGTVLGPHVVLESHVKLGKHCSVAASAVLGGLPQDHAFGGETSWVEIGDHCQIREFVTVNRGTGEGTVTKMGDHCMIMAYSHLAHNCILGDHVVLANNVQLAGFVEIGDYAFLSGVCVVHQFVKIGRMTIVSGLSGTRQDLPPFATTEGRPAVVVGINRVALKRQNVSLQSRNNLKRAFQVLFFSRQNLAEAVEICRTEIQDDPYVDELIDFVQTSKRGIHRMGEAATAEASLTEIH